ncbi:cytochrome C biogenesis protein CcdA [Methylopila jiangsuensis]|uniref:Cytochrome C biogenesis protein CcdA n=1 Tax=Methylopila jiangsuensis TaxID=586230 RepID=A0A9W6JCP4_9HYPH|nr:cytochrome c biogenesis protein CcdA [Methylopila jiangsuensis]MDR6285379.1 cytochrome c-type biogenesis protein [Methylopila jiangsuensis]GLK75135.1 cytochrome C biogenesis protein CcdA [Methylopila jiangsuensis]
MISDVTLPAVFAAGALSFLSPCVLPLVPPYLCFLAGSTLDQLVSDERPRSVSARTLGAAALFVLGFATVFVALGATASALGRLLLANAPLLASVAGVAIIVMGLHFLGVFRIGFLMRDTRMEVQKPVGLWGAYLMGLAFAFGWTPCIGPVLAAVLSVAASETTVASGAGLLAVYAAGLGLPFLIAAFAMKPFIAFLKRFRAHLGTVEKVTGGLLVLTGLAFLTGFTATASFWLLETFPGLATLG